MQDEKITKQDIKEIVGEAIEEFAQIVNQGFNELNGKIDSVEERLNGKIDSVEERLNGKIDNIISGNDSIAKEIKDMRSEQAAIIGGRERIDDTLLEYGDRLKKLEIHTKLKQTEIMI